MQEENREYPEKNLQKQVWTENQMNLQLRDRELIPGSVVHSTGEVPLRYLLHKLMALLEVRWKRLITYSSYV